MSDGYTRQNADSQGSPNIGALADIQDNWDLDDIASAKNLANELTDEKIADIEYVAEYTVASDATTPIAITIPLGAVISDVKATCTGANAVGTLTVQVGGGGTAITSAIVCAVIDVISRTTKVVQSVKTVGANGIEVVAHGAADEGIVSITYKV